MKWFRSAARGDAGGISGQRRSFLRARRTVRLPVRPPWAISWSRGEDAFAQACTRCDACVTACPEGIVKPGDGGFPEIDLRISECTFCRACADACKAPAFDLTGAPWSLTVRVTDACLSAQATFCRSCGDACAERAITFPPAQGGVSVPRIDAATCTGCGACVSACPVGAVVPTRPSSTSSLPETA
jgi:ferredoxin-type protein NapF